MNQINPSKLILLAILTGSMAVILVVLISFTFKLNLVANLILSYVVTTMFSIFAFFLLTLLIRRNIPKYIEKPVYISKEVIKEVPVDKIVNQVVYKTKYKTRYKTKIIEKKRKKLNIPKFKFIGSTQTMTYHKNTCKFSKMLKRKYKLHSNTKAFFIKKNYKACKTCLKKKIKKSKK